MIIQTLQKRVLFYWLLIQFFWFVIQDIQFIKDKDILCDFYIIKYLLIFTKITKLQNYLIIKFYLCYYCKSKLNYLLNF